jgi:serine/threonine protein kinase
LTREILPAKLGGGSVDEIKRGSAVGVKSGIVIKTAFESYTVGRQLGQGGSGVVYEVRDPDGVLFAAKVLDQTKAERNRLKRFKNEADFCSRNKYKNIIKVVGVGVTNGGSSFYVMPLYSRTLRDLMAMGIRQEDVLSLYGQILDGVEAAHLQNIWHRDLKPENILWGPAERALVVADFGIAHFEEEELFTAVETKAGEKLANFLYAAPEQKIRGKAVDQKADVYALGLMLHEMFLGEPPLGTGHRKVADVAPEYAYLDSLIELMRSQEPAARPLISDVKKELVARGLQFIELQRLDEMKKQVVPESEISDQIVTDPIRLEQIEDYQNGELTIRLNRAVNDRWVTCFMTRATRWSGSVSSRMVSFYKDHVILSVSEHHVPEAVRFVQDYLTPANEDYAALVRKEHVAAIEWRKEEQRMKIAQEEARQKTLAKIRETTKL